MLIILKYNVRDILETILSYDINYYHSNYNNEDLFDFIIKYNRYEYLEDIISSIVNKNNDGEYLKLYLTIKFSTYNKKDKNKFYDKLKESSTVPNYITDVFKTGANENIAKLKLLKYLIILNNDTDKAANYLNMENNDSIIINSLFN